MVAKKIVSKMKYDDDWYDEEEEYEEKSVNNEDH